MTFDPVNSIYGGFIGTHFMTISTVNYEAAQINIIVSDFVVITIISNSRTQTVASDINILGINESYLQVLQTNTFLSDLSLGLGNNKVIFYLDGAEHTVDIPSTMTRTYRIDETI